MADRQITLVEASGRGVRERRQGDASNTDKHVDRETDRQMAGRQMADRQITKLAVHLPIQNCG